MRNVLRNLLPSAALLVLVPCLAGSAVAQTSETCPTSPNSVGPGAVLRWSGPTSLATGSMLVQGLPRNSVGMFLYGFSADSTPFGDGVSCIGGARWVLARKKARQGTVGLDVAGEGESDDLRWLAQNPGRTVHFQYLYRDPRAHGTGFNLSNGLAVSFASGLQ